MNFCRSANLGNSITYICLFITIVYLYKNKFTTKDDNAYVYVNIGYATLADDTSTYGDITRIEENTSENFSINESNYTKYSEYKYTFKKDSNDNYYFVSVEKN